MLQKIDNKYFFGHGTIQMMYPGLAFSQTDTGIASIGRIDHAYLNGKQTIKMHPHSNDEILSYFRSGTAEHLDSQGIQATVGGTKLMLMKAGDIFYHEETISNHTDNAFEGLQIFIRPAKKDLTPEVSFYDLDEKFSVNQWRLLASPTDETPLQFSSQSWVWDTKLSNGNMLDLPNIAQENKLFLLYVYQGKVKVNGVELVKKESILIQDENVRIETDSEAELVLFATDLKAEVYAGGMFSGNQR